MSETRITIKPSTYETIDLAVFDFINEKMNIFCTTHKGWEKVSVIWAGSERVFQSKNNSDIKDIDNTLIYPIISISRESISKNNNSKGKYYANIPKQDDYKGGSIVIGKKIKHDKTANFANADSFKKFSAINFRNRKENKKIVYEIYSMPQPVYNEINYKIKIIAEYQQQMNEIIQPFIVKPGSINRIMIERDNYRYEAFIKQELSLNKNTDNMTEESRKFETTIEIKVYGYLISGDSNETEPYITVRENAVEFKFPREHVVWGDIPPFPGHGKYKP